ncbi:MAG: DNA-3-methyladenine glycosylase family protein, partial [Oscillospiraceae bacterium]
DIHLSQPDFDLDETLDCGQAFRWEKTSNSAYHGAILYNGTLDKQLTIYKEKDYFVLENTSESDLLNVWRDYFDLDTDYGELKRIYSEDETLAKACKYASGIRLLKQNAWEALVSFIISQNNNIPRIKGIIGRLCEENNGFPSVEKLKDSTADDFAYLRAGFRAKYLESCVSLVTSGEISLERISAAPADEARAELMKIKGVGPKVADCTMLYGMYKTECFPVDVWIKRVLAQFYPNGLPEFIKPTAGIAQQYLFHYIRTSGVYEV